MPKPVAFSNFIGMDNRSPDYSLRIRDGVRELLFVRDAVNVDPIPGGNFRTRPGASQVAPVNGTALFADSSALYYASAGALKKVTIPFAETTVAALTPVAWASTPLGPYFSDNTDVYRLAGGSVSKSLPSPAAVTVAAFGSGNLPAGIYQVTCTYVAADGRESGAPESNTATVAVGGALTVTLPPAVAAASHVAVYVTQPNGTVPQLAKLVACGTPSTLVTDVPTGRAIQTQYLVPLPGGSQLACYNGRLLSVKDNFVYVSEAYNYSLHHPVKGYLAFPAPVSLVAPCDNGVYVVADKTYWLSGPNPLDAQLLPVLPFGGVPGTAGELPTERKVFWFTERGFVVGDAQGQVKAVQDAHVAPPSAVRGASYVKEDTGRVQLVVSLENPTISPRSADGWVDGLANWEGQGANDLGAWTSTLDGATSRYTCYQFNSFATLDGVSYGLSTSGLYRLDAPYTTVQDSMVNLGVVDFGSSALKGLASFWLEGSSSDVMHIQVVTDEDAYVYSTEVAFDSLRTVRADLGRGLRSTSYIFSIYSNPYSFIELRKVEINAAESLRRVG